MNRLNIFGVFTVSLLVGMSNASADGLLDGLGDFISDNVQITIGNRQTNQQPVTNNPGTALPGANTQPIIQVGPAVQIPRLKRYQSRYRNYRDVTRMDQILTDNGSKAIPARATLLVSNKQGIPYQTFDTSGDSQETRRLNRRELARRANQLANGRCIQRTLSRMSHVMNRSYIPDDMAMKIQYLRSRGYSFLMNQEANIIPLDGANTGLSRFRIRPQIEISKNGRKLYTMKNTTAQLTLPGHSAHANRNTYCKLPAMVEKAIEKEPKTFLHNFYTDSRSMTFIINDLYRQAKAGVETQDQGNEHRWRDEWLHKTNSQENINQGGDTISI